jgi:hypothetical protein
LAQPIQCAWYWPHGQQCSGQIWSLSTFFTLWLHVLRMELHMHDKVPQLTTVLTPFMSAVFNTNTFSLSGKSPRCFIVTIWWDCGSAAADWPIFHLPDDTWVNVEQWWNDTDNWKAKHLEKNMSQYHSVRHKSHMGCPGCKSWASTMRCHQLTAWTMALPATSLSTDSSYSAQATRSYCCVLPFGLWVFLIDMLLLHSHWASPLKKFISCTASAPLVSLLHVRRLFCMCHAV